MNGANLAEAVDGLDEMWRKILLIDNKEMLGRCIKAVNAKVGGESTRLAPPPELIFRAFKLCPYGETRVVVVGQDPYPKLGDAVGLSFSTAKDRPIPSSLINIYKCLQRGGHVPSMPTHGCLDSWATQGVLMINTALTTEVGKMKQHVENWQPYTNAIIRSLARAKAESGGRLIFALWGNDAHEVASIVDKVNDEFFDSWGRPLHVVLRWGHPSPLSSVNQQATNPKNFLFCDHFTLINNILDYPIDWNPDAMSVSPMTKAAAEIHEEELAGAIIVACDGAAHAPGKALATASWSYVVVAGSEIKTMRGGCKEEDLECYEEYERVEGGEQTNNRGELTAILKGLCKVEEECIDGDIYVVSDSLYALSAIDIWSRTWDGDVKMKAEKKNLDLIYAARAVLDKFRESRKVSFLHIRGHTKPPPKESPQWVLWSLNDRVDKNTQKALAK